MLVSVSPIRSPDGTLIGAATVARDIGAELAAERRIRDLNEALEGQVEERTAQLQTSLALQSAIIAQTGYAVIAIDEAGTINLFNAAAEDMLGYAAAEVVGRFTPKLFDDATTVAPSKADGAKGGDDGQATGAAHATWGMPDDGVWTLLTKTRKQVPVRLNIRRLHSIAGRDLGHLMVARDLTEQLAREAELEAARDAAESAARAKAEFLATMSHELRTPLNSIIGFSDLMLSSGELKDPMTQRQARLVHDASLTLLSIVNDVLDVSKMEAGGLDLDLHAFSVHALVETVVGILKGEADRKSLALKVTLADNLPNYVVGDSARLRQILINLVSNSLKFTMAGSVTIDVVARSFADVSELRFAVVDTGIGIPREHRNRIFNRFSQADSSTSRRFGGSGLGLSICKSLVELMGGVIAFESAEGLGSEFWFTIRLPQASGLLQAAAEDVDEKRPPKALSILLAEDVEVNQELAVAHLHKMGHLVDVVPDGRAAVEATRRKAYDLILMDVNMPVMDGLAATAQIRASEDCACRIPIIAMTANVMADEVARYKRSGMDDHLGKPFLPLQLADVIGRWRDRRSSFPGIGPGRPAAHKLASPSFDEEVITELMDLLGSAKVAMLANQLVVDLRTRFDRSANHDGLRKEAHMTASAAGAMGLTRLCNASRRLENTRRGSSDWAVSISLCVEARNEAIEILRSRFGPLMRSHLAQDEASQR